MPIVSELQRDRVALLLTLNVLLFVGYTVTVIMLVAVPSLWLVTFLIIGLCYNVFELWQSSPNKQPPDAVGIRARNQTPTTAVVAPPKLGRAHRADPVLGTQGIASGRESLSQRLAELQASMPLQTAPEIEIAARSVGASSAMETTEADAVVLSELSVAVLEHTGSESVEFTAHNNPAIAGPQAAEPTAMIITSVVAANDAQVSDIAEAEPPILKTIDVAALEAAEQAPSIGSETVITPVAAAMVVDAGIPVPSGMEMAPAAPEVPILSFEQAIGPVLESVAEENPVAAPSLAQIDDSVATTPPVIAATAADQFKGTAERKVDVEPEPAVAGVAIPAVTHVAGRRRDVVDIVIASIVSDAKRPQAAEHPAPDEQTALAAKVRTPSESLAILRSELAKTRGHPGAAAQTKAPAAPRKPLGAARKPGKSPADGTRDRVMFVWHGRHFLAPIEGRHPLRVAQSLYDFMVEEAMEHG